MSNVFCNTPWLHYCVYDLCGVPLVLKLPALFSWSTWIHWSPFQLLKMGIVNGGITNIYLHFISCVLDPLIGHMEMVTEIVVPTVCTLCILLSAVFLMFLLRGRLWETHTDIVTYVNGLEAKETKLRVTPLLQNLILSSELCFIICPPILFWINTQVDIMKSK